eukprot:1156252-Pelagomonas_calceolata.AAC.1
MNRVCNDTMDKGMKSAGGQAVQGCAKKDLIIARDPGNLPACTRHYKHEQNGIGFVHSHDFGCAL